MRRAIVVLGLLGVLVFFAGMVQAHNSTDSQITNSTHRTDFQCTDLPSQECNALVALYDSTDGPGWFNKTGWKTNPQACQWYGVTCANGHVSDIHLQQNGLYGTLPAALGDFPALKTLWLWGNYLQGSIPPQIGNLTQLRELSLVINNLTGPIPSEIGSMTALQSVGLGRNRLSGSLPATMGNLTQLTFFEATNNQLGGDVPASILNLTNLSQFVLDYNKFTASDPAVAAFLNGIAPGWNNTQTVAVTNFAGAAQTNGTITLTWMPIAYQADGGYYEIRVGAAAAGPFTPYQQVLKSVSSLNSGGWTPGSTYYFQICTYTPAHGYQQNALWSDTCPVIAVTVSVQPSPTPSPSPSPTPVVTASNIAAGCPVIARSGGVTYAPWGNANDAVDYNTTTNAAGGRWGNQTNSGSGTFEIVDLGGVYQLTGVGYRLDWDGAFANALTFQVAVSVDNATWTVVSEIAHPVANTPGASTVDQNVALAPVTARYVRYWEPNDGNWNGWGDFFHLRAYSLTPSTTCGTVVPTPTLPPTNTPLPTSTVTPLPTATATVVPTDVPTMTPSPTELPSATPTETPTEPPTSTPTPEDTIGDPSEV